MSQDDQPVQDLSEWPVAILAGGLATRLGKIAAEIPKALVKVAGEPFLFHQLRLLKRHGFREIVLCLGHLGGLIQERVGDGNRFGLRVTCSFDGPKLLGTGGAIKHALRYLGNSFVVLYGDSYLPVDYAAIVQAFCDSKSPALMTVFKNCDRWDTSNAWLEDGVLKEYDKNHRRPEMHYIDYGIAVLSAAPFSRHPEGKKFALADLYTELVKARAMAAFEVQRRFYEIGSTQGIAELDCLLRSNSIETMP